MKVLVRTVFWCIVFGNYVSATAIRLKIQELPIKISVHTFWEGLKTNENVRQHIEKILLDLKQYEYLDIESSESCGMIQESFVQQTLQEIPIEGVLKRIAELTLYMGEGCTRRAFELGNLFLKKKCSLDALINCGKVDNDKCFVENEIRLSEHLHQSVSVGFMYDVFSAAVYGSEHHMRPAEIHVNNIIMETMGEEFSQPTVQEFLNNKIVSGVRRHECVDEVENRAQEVISWIPIIGTLYNLTSSAVYGATGCQDIAKERVFSGTKELAMDIDIAVTPGGGAVAFQGIKMATKFGLKAMLQAAKSVEKQVVKSQSKSMAKLYANPVKRAINTVKDVVQIPKLINAVGKRALKTISGKINKLDKVEKTGNTFFKKIQRCRRSPTRPCNVKKLQDAKLRSEKRAKSNRDKFETIKKLPKSAQQQQLDKMTVKQWANVLQQQTPLTQFETERVIGGQNMKIRSRKPQFPKYQPNQFFYSINNRYPTYNDITKSLDDLSDNQRRDLANAMLQEMEKTPSNSIDFANIGGHNKVGIDKAKKASELIILTQIAEAVPGRTPGSDKDFRAVLRSIIESQGVKKFHDTVIRGYPPASIGGTSVQRQLANSDTNDYSDAKVRSFVRTSINKQNEKGYTSHIDFHEVESVKNHYSDNSPASSDGRRKRQTTQ